MPLNPRDAVIVDAVRTPVGRRKGALAQVHAVDLSAQVLRALADRTGLDAAVVDDVIWGCVVQVGMHSANVGRNAVLTAGWPESVPATTIDRQCGSSQQAVHFAAAGIAAGHYDVAVAGGVEMMTQVPLGAAQADAVYGFPYPPAMLERYGVDMFHQGIGAEMIAQKWGLSREVLDAYAARSHERLAAALAAGELDDHVTPVVVGDGAEFARDEGLREGTSVESLAGLKPVFKDDGVIHAGNSSQISDGAAALLLMSAGRAESLGLTPLARVHTAVVAGDDPVMMLTAPIPATHKALERSGLSLADIGVFEVNEAFASVPLAWQAEFGVDEALLNPGGGAIAIGHPLGASGARIMSDMVFRMKREGIRYGLQTMCEGGGMANATILELL